MLCCFCGCTYSLRFLILLALILCGGTQRIQFSAQFRFLLASLTRLGLGLLAQSFQFTQPLLSFHSVLARCFFQTLALCFISRFCGSSNFLLGCFRVCTHSLPFLILLPRILSTGAQP